jgi:hypothetical protein
MSMATANDVLSTVVAILNVGADVAWIRRLDADICSTSRWV